MPAAASAPGCTPCCAGRAPRGRTRKWRGCAAAWTPMAPSSTRGRWRTGSRARPITSSLPCTAMFLTRATSASSRRCPHGSSSAIDRRVEVGLMTPEAFTRQLPPVANDSLLIRPPYEFRGLSVRVFPLRANLDALQQLANDYLNCVPPEVGRFRAVVPYAYLAFLDYGQITEHVLPIGWFAQTEVFLSVPVEWYTVVNGRWTFHDWAVFTPYIFVNDDFSVPMGRMLYGFPKTLAR